MSEVEKIDDLEHVGKHGDRKLEAVRKENIKEEKAVDKLVKDIKESTEEL